MARLLILGLGPALIIGLSYLLAAPAGGSSSQSQQGEPAEGTSENRSTIERAPTAHLARGDRELGLLPECQRRREMLMKRMGSGHSSIVHSPFVVAGDMPVAELE